MSARIEVKHRQNRAMKCDQCGMRTRRLGLWAHLISKHKEKIKVRYTQTTSA
jgi:hypothetical protein